MIEQFVPQEACLKCQGCCRFAQEDSVWVPSLLNEEIEKLLKGSFPPSLLSLDKKIRAISFKNEGIYICALFNPEENKCKIYEYRPFECQLYPFLINRKEDKVFLALDLKCPFAKDKVNTREFQEYSRYLSGLLKTPQYLEILKNNPHAIQAYAEVLDLSEL